MTSRIDVVARSWGKEREVPRPLDPGAATIEQQHVAWFTRFYEANWEAVFRYVDRLSGDPELAADIGQEAFLRLLRRGSMPEDPMPWLVTVAHNLLRDQRRKVQRRVRILAGRSAGAGVADPPRAPDDAAAGQETNARVRSVLDEMPERSRQILLLRAEGLKYKEIAAVMGVEVSSVGSLLVRATDAFKRRMEESGVAPH